jgi:hypothetical protein
MRELLGHSRIFRPFGTNTHRQDDIKMDLTDTQNGSMDWTEVAYDSDELWTVVNRAMKL